MDRITFVVFNGKMIVVLRTIFQKRRHTWCPSSAAPARQRLL